MTADHRHRWEEMPMVPPEYEARDRCADCGEIRVLTEDDDAGWDRPG